jgi:hypothetical protein
VNALIYLQVASFVGLVRTRLLRLKQPKYLVGAVVGAAYMYFFFLRRTAGVRAPGGLAQASHLTAWTSLDAFSLYGSVLLLVMLLLGWLLPRLPASLAFSEAEIAFLFPAPISRRTLVHHRLLGTLLAVLLASAVLTLFSNRWALLGGSPVSHLLGWWLILATMSLHTTASSFAISRLMSRGVSVWVVRLAALALIVGCVVLLFGPPTAADLASQAATRAYLWGLLNSGPVSWVLLPTRLVIAPFLAPDWRTFALALPGALGVLGVLYVWALFAAESFEEASVARAEKRAARNRARQTGGASAGAAPLKPRRARFRLAPTGRPETAFLWKNLLATPSFIRPGTAVIAALIIAGACAWLSTHPAYRGALSMVTVSSAILGGYAMFLGPLVVRYDLRADLLNADLLKTYPLRGWQVIIGELLAPVAILTVVVWLALLAAALSASLPAGVGIDVAARAGITVALAVLAPPVCALQLLLPNTIAVVFPAWAQAMANRQERGFDVLGQRLIFVWGQLMVMILGLVPAAICGAVAFFLVDLTTSWPSAAMAGCLAASVALAGEVWLGVRWLGGRFERFDLASELRK